MQSSIIIYILKHLGIILSLTLQVNACGLKELITRNLIQIDWLTIYNDDPVDGHPPYAQMYVRYLDIRYTILSR